MKLGNTLTKIAKKTISLEGDGSEDYSSEGLLRRAGMTPASKGGRSALLGAAAAGIPASLIGGLIAGNVDGGSALGGALALGLPAAGAGAVGGYALGRGYDRTRASVIRQLLASGAAVDRD